MTPPTAKNPLEYAVALMGEECSEIIKEGFKIERFGMFDRRPSTQVPNHEILQGEITDFMATIRILNQELARAGLPLMRLDDEEGIQRKLHRVASYGQRSINNGTLSAPLQVMLDLNVEAS